MHFYFIDPKNDVIEKITGKPSLDQIYTLLDCRMIDAVRLPNTYDFFYCDDEGLLRHTIEAANMIHTGNEDYPDSFIAGRMLYMGIDNQGESISPDKTFQFGYQFKNTMRSWIHADPEKEITCRLTRHLRGPFGIGTVPYRCELKGIKALGFAPKEKTLEDKLEELENQEAEQEG